MKKLLFIPICASALLVAGCVVSPKAPTATNTDVLTLGTVQQSIHKGMSQTDVLEALGSPNLISRDKTGLETWAYDKNSTTVTVQKDDVYGTVILLGASASAGTSTQSQRTLTLILKFKDGLLDQYSYRSTSF